MATTNDIDTKTAVRKFLEARTVVDREDGTSDSADEVAAVLESVALSFLLYPQAALSFVLQAKNVLQQIVSTDVEIVEFMLKTIDDIDNPDEPVTDLSDLVEAQTALVEVDRLGRVSDDVRAYDRYTQAIDRFLDQRLAKSIKRHRRAEFERTGTEAKQDLFRVLSAFGPTHGLMVGRLELLLDSVTNFQSVALTRIVSTKTLTRVRSSLKKVIQSVQQQTISKSATAVELLSGAAALSSISNTRSVYDPTIDTGDYPPDRTITVSSELIGAVATGAEGEVDLSAISTPWVFDITVNGENQQVTLPYSGASGRAYVKTSSEAGAATFNIPADQNVLYVQFDGITPVYPDVRMVKAVILPSGSAVTLSAILSALNHVTDGLVYGTAVELAPDSGRILIYGSPSVTRMVVRAVVPGTFDWMGGSGDYTEATKSVHAILGFADDQESGDPNIFTPTELVDLLSATLEDVEVSLVDEAVTIATTSTTLLTNLVFTGSVAEAFAFEGTYRAKPSYLELMEDGEAIDPASVGVFVGSVFSATDAGSHRPNNLFGAVQAIEGTQLSFGDTPLPRCAESSVRVVSPLVYAVQTLFDNLRPYRDSFDQDSRNLQRVLSPLLSKPTLAQLNDAKGVLEDIQDTLESLRTTLSETVVRIDQTEFGEVARQIIAALEERGLDRALELLQTGQFAEFFGLTREEASKGNRFLKASEQVGRNDFAQTTIEQDLDDLEPKGSTPDENLLPGEELLEDEEQL